MLTAATAVYLALAIAYSFAFPLGHAPDEPAHFAYVLFIAENGRLPDFYADGAGYESYQAPLYYTLCAGVCKLALLAADTLGAPPTPRVPRQLLEAAEPGAKLPPRVHKHPWVAREQYRLMLSAWRQALSFTAEQRLAWRVTRVFTALIGAGGVIVGWLIMRVLFPSRRWLADLVACTMATLPMYTHICSAVGNDPLTVVVVGLSVLMILLVLRDGPTPRRVGLLGLSLGLGMLTKDSANATIPVALVALAWAAGRRYQPEPARSYLTDLARRVAALRWGLILRRAGLMAAVMAALAGWWYVRNLMHYGHLMHFPANREKQLPWDFYLIYPEHLGTVLGLAVPMTFRNFWGNFAWTNIALPPWLYWALLVVSLLPLPGLLLLVLDVRVGRLTPSQFQRRGFAAVMAVMVLMVMAVTGYVLFIDIGGGSQGRYLFPILFGLSGLWGLGVGRLLPAPVREELPFIVGGAMLVFNLYCLLGVIVPFYRALGA